MYICEIKTSSIPLPHQIHSAIEVIKQTFDQDGEWFIGSDESEEWDGDQEIGETKLIPYSDQSLQIICEESSEALDGIQESSLYLINQRQKIYVTFERIKIERKKLKKVINRGHFKINTLLISFEALPSKQALHNLISGLVNILLATYGRIYLAGHAAKRLDGKFDIYGGLPGLHIMNFFGPPIAPYLNTDQIRLLPGAKTQATADGYLLEFNEKIGEFTREELDKLQPIFGNNIFRKFDDKYQQTTTNFFRWATTTWLDNRRYLQDKVIFDFDVTPMLID